MEPRGVLAQSTFRRERCLLFREFLRRVKRRQRDRARRIRRAVHGCSAEWADFRRAVSSREIVDGGTSPAEELRAMDVIPSIDVLQGNAVRLTGGQFNMLTK